MQNDASQIIQGYILGRVLAGATERVIETLSSASEYSISIQPGILADIMTIWDSYLPPLVSSEGAVKIIVIDNAVLDAAIEECDAADNVNDANAAVFSMMFSIRFVARSEAALDAAIGALDTAGAEAAAAAQINVPRNNSSTPRWPK